jgi:hypothetical protein
VGHHDFCKVSSGTVECDHVIHVDQQQRLITDVFNQKVLADSERCSQSGYSSKQVIRDRP